MNSIRFAQYRIIFLFYARYSKYRAVFYLKTRKKMYYF